MASTVYPPYNHYASDSTLEYSAPVNPASTNEALNLSVLQRHLPSTISIAFLAPYAVVYIYNITTNTWEKSGIEGTLFVVKLQDEDYAVVVLNRRGLDNFILRLKSAEEVDVAEEYVILQGNGGVDLGNGDVDTKKVYGLWIFDEGQGSTKGVREACGRCIVECAAKARGSGVGGGQSSNTYAQQPAAAAPSGPDLMALLNASRR